MGVLGIFICVLEIFDGCPGDTLWVSWRYLMCAREIFFIFPGNISFVSSRY